MDLNEMRRAVRYYEGDVLPAEANDPFWGDPRAYISLNALLFPGLRSEQLRVREGKRLNPAFFADPARLAMLMRALLAAAEWGRCKSACEGFRVERAEDFAAYADTGETVCFTSTCRSGFLREYGDKRGIVLMHFTLPAGTPCIVFTELLTDYAKSAEDELLLPPFLRFSCAERPLTSQEREITDMEGNPPLHAYELTAAPALLCTGDTPLPDPPECAARVWAALNADQEPAPADAAAYLKWKADWQTALK